MIFNSLENLRQKEKGPCTFIKFSKYQATNLQLDCEDNDHSGRLRSKSLLLFRLIVKTTVSAFGKDSSNVFLMCVLSSFLVQNTVMGTMTVKTRLAKLPLSRMLLTYIENTKPAIPTNTAKV